MESLDAFSNYKEEGEKIFNMRNDMQQALILEGAPWEGKKEDFDHYVLDWIENNGEAFKNAFDELQTRHPHLLADWHDKREEVMSELRQLLPGVQTPRRRAA